MSNTNKQNEWKDREIGALWKRNSKNGKSTYCTGYIISDELGNKIKQRVIMFANKTKSNEKSPDFVIYISAEPEGGEPQATQAAAPAKPRPTAATRQNRPAPRAAAARSDDAPNPSPSDEVEDDGVPM